MQRRLFKNADLNFQTCDISKLSAQISGSRVQSGSLFSERLFNRKVIDLVPFVGILTMQNPQKVIDFDKLQYSVSLLSINLGLTSSIKD